MAAQVGDRVIAISHTEENTVYVFGSGIYAGCAEEDAGFPTKKILLDDGQVVYGYECWWGPEAVIQEKIKNMHIVHYSISDARNGIAPSTGR